MRVVVPSWHYKQLPGIGFTGITSGFYPHLISLMLMTNLSRPSTVWHWALNSSYTGSAPPSSLLQDCGKCLMQDALTEGFLWGPQDIVPGLQPPWEALAEDSDFQKQSFIQFLKEPMDIHLPSPLQGCPRATDRAADTAQASPPGPGMHRVEDRNRQGSFPAPLVTHPEILQIWTQHDADNSAFWDSTQCYLSAKLCCAGTPPTSSS